MEHKNMRDAFTMIEVVFVIVIVGILTTIAIPKLFATRDDAKARVVLSALTTCINEAGVTYMKSTSFGAVTDEQEGSVNCKKARECFAFEVSDVNGTLKVEDLNKTTVVCQEAVRIANNNGLLREVSIRF